MQEDEHQQRAGRRRAARHRATRQLAPEKSASPDVPLGPAADARIPDSAGPNVWPAEFGVDLAGSVSADPPLDLDEVLEQFEVERTEAREQLAAEVRRRERAEQQTAEAIAAVEASREGGAVALSKMRDRCIELQTRLGAAERLATTTAHQLQQAQSSGDLARAELAKHVERSDAGERLLANAEGQLAEVTTRIAAVDRRMHNTRQQLIEAEQLLADERERAAAEFAAEQARRQRVEQRLAESDQAGAELKRKLREVESRLAASEQRVADADAQLTAAAETLSGLHLRVRARGPA